MVSVWEIANDQPKPIKCPKCDSRRLRIAYLSDTLSGFRQYGLKEREENFKIHFEDFWRKSKKLDQTQRFICEICLSFSFAYKDIEVSLKIDLDLLL